MRAYIAGRRDVDLLAQMLMRGGRSLDRLDSRKPFAALKLLSKPRLTVRARTASGKLYVKSGDYMQTVEQLRFAAKCDPSDRMAFSQLPIALRRLGRNEEASAAQKFNFNASWSVRGEFCVPVMTPKLVDPTVTLGSAKMGVLVTLNASPRI
jgi:hypothetical protein